MDLVRNSRGIERFHIRDRIPGLPPHDAPGPQGQIVMHFDGLDKFDKLRVDDDSATYAPFTSNKEDRDIRQWDPVVIRRNPIARGAIFQNEPLPKGFSSVNGILKHADNVLGGFATNPGDNNGHGGPGSVVDVGVLVVVGTVGPYNYSPLTWPCLTPLRIDLNPFAVREPGSNQILCGIDMGSAGIATRLMPQLVPIDAPNIMHDINVTAHRVQYEISGFLQHGTTFHADDAIKKVQDYLDHRLVEELNPLEVFAMAEAAQLMLSFSMCFYQQHITAFVDDGMDPQEAAHNALLNFEQATRMTASILNKFQQQDQLAVDRHHRFTPNFDDPLARHSNADSNFFPYCDVREGSATHIDPTQYGNPMVQHAFASRVYTLLRILHQVILRSITHYVEWISSKAAGLNIYETCAGDSGTVIAGICR